MPRLRNTVREPHGADAARLRAHDVAGAAAALRHGVFQNELRHLRALAATCASPWMLHSRRAFRRMHAIFQMRFCTMVVFSEC